MSKSLTIARQSAHPRGWLGHIVARVMALETSGVNRLALEALGVAPDERVLEIGCGHGRTLRAIARQAERVTRAGVDPSDVMLGVARHHFRQQLARGDLILARGNAAALPFPRASFDRALSVHTTYFWPDLDTGLNEIRRVLRPHGQLVLAFRLRNDSTAAALLPASLYRLDSGPEMQRAPGAAHFSQVDIEMRRFGSSSLALATATRPRRRSLPALAVAPNRDEAV